MKLADRALERSGQPGVVVPAGDGLPSFTARGIRHRRAADDGSGRISFGAYWTLPSRHKIDVGAKVTFLGEAPMRVSAIESSDDGGTTVRLQQ